MSSWDDADERERPSGFGGDWRGARPTFDDPMSWSFAVLRVAGITVRLHVFFLVFILVVLAHAASVTSEGAVGVLPTMLGLVALFAVILLHEFGHCFACRRKGGTADEILLWPLGGLATCNPPERPSAHLWTALGGPLVNVAIIAVLTPAIGIWTGGWWGRAIPNPLDLGGMIQRADFGEDLVGWAQMFAFLTNYIAWVLLLFNLIPMFPLDGGRILQAVLWRRVGYAASMRIACRAGIVGAVAIGVGALVAESTMLLGIAVFGGFVCVATARHIDHERDFLGFEPDPSELAAMEEELDEPRERPQDFGRVVRLARAAALGVRDGHDTVERRKHPRHHLQPRRKLPRKTRRARRRAEDDHGIARAHAARPRPAITGKGARHRRRLDRRAGPEGRLVQLKRLKVVREIRPRRQRKRQPPHRQRFEHRGVAHVVARRDRRERMTEGQPPREQRLARRDGPDGEAMTFEDVLRERARRPVELDHRPRLQGPHRDRDIVPGSGQATDVMQEKSLVHTPTTMRTAPAASRRNRNQAPRRTLDAPL